MTGTHTFLRLVRECRRYPVRILAALISLAGLGAARLYLTWLLKRGVEPLTRGEQAVVAGLLMQGAATAGAMIVALFASRYLLNSINQRMVARLRDAAQRQLLSLAIPTVREFRSGELMSRIFNDVGVLAGFARDVLKRLIGESMVIVGGLAFMFYLRWQLALITCITAPLVALLLDKLGRMIRRRSAQAQSEIGVLSAILSEQLFGLSTIKGFQTESFEHQRFADRNARYRRQVMRGELWSAMLVSAVAVVGAGALFGIIWYGGRQAMTGHMTPGELLAFCLYAIQTIEPMRRVSEVQGTLQGALAAAGRVYQLIDLPRAEQPLGGALAMRVDGRLRFESVHFEYRMGEPVLDGIDISIAAGETVAVVSASGGGKSTLANLLMRFFDPCKGRILLDGCDTRTMPLADLRRAVCVVEQDPFIMSGPLIDNVRYGSWTASRATVSAAVALVGLEPLVRSLPGGLDSVLRESGRDLSGGQKQRIALARAIVRDPSVLVLDEATSALDSDSERLIFARLQAWLQQRTVIVMAHRLATIRRFDRVLVLQAGHIVGDGSVPDLVENCPPFCQLFGEQISPLDWRPVASARLS